MPKVGLDDFLAAGGSLEELIKTASSELKPFYLDEPVPASSSVPATPRPLADPAYHGLVGEYVRQIAPETEADPVGILVQFLTLIGNLVGRGPHFKVGADYHPYNLFAVLVGLSAKARKGVSLGIALHPFRLLDEDWVETRTTSGLSSGEGLINAVSDEVADKRLLVSETEFASVLKVISRDGNTLSAIIRNAWDTGRLSTLTRNNPLRATDAHISILGHITQQELIRYLTTTESGNGFANRFLWVHVKRARLLPEGGNLHSVDFQSLLERLRDLLEWSKFVGEMKRDDNSRKFWHEVYGPLTADRPGLFGSVTARAEAQVMRIAGIYALLDRSSLIRLEHLHAGLAVWQYCEDSARFIFGDSLGDPLADEILQLLRQSPDGKSRTEIRDAFSRNKRSESINRALELLKQMGLADYRMQPTDGRPVEIWFAL